MVFRYRGPSGSAGQTRTWARTHQRANILQVFISDIRSCSNKEQEQLRVDKELGKIRKKFASGNVLSGRGIDPYKRAYHQPSLHFTVHGYVSEYDKKKYVWKLLYIYMLGYDVEFGHKQAADLIPVNK